MAITSDEFKRILIKFRDEEPHSLYFEPRLDRLMDSEECQGFSTVLHESGRRWERRPATATLATMLPDERGIYMFVWCPALSLLCDEGSDSKAPRAERFRYVLYVGKAGVEEGKTDTLKERFKSGYAKYIGNDPSPLWTERVPDDPKREQLLSRYLALRPLEFWYIILKDMKEIQTFEKKLIKTLNPPLNKQHGRRLRIGKAEPA